MEYAVIGKLKEYGKTNQATWYEKCRKINQYAVDKTEGFKPPHLYER